MNAARTSNGNVVGYRTASTTGRRPRTPGVAYAAVSLVLLALVATMALASREPSSPTIAEFAPQAVEQITDSSGDRAGPSGGATGETPTLDEGAGADSPATQNVDVARVRQCVGDPPRQIEDPQSPPCVPYWSGDNGGATSRGVTRDEIRVVNPIYNAIWSPALEAFFNRRFEFYGRQVRLIPRSVPRDPTGQRAAARAVYEEDRAFASTPPFCDAGCYAYLDEIARYGILGGPWAPTFPETYLAAHRPYVWQYTMANDRMFAMTGNWYCARLAGRNAIHAGDPLLQASPRKPGIVLIRADQTGTAAEPMNAQFASCGSRTNAVIEGTDPGSDASYWTAFMENAMLRMKTSGVSTVAVLCEWMCFGIGMRAATNQGYFPEWLLTSYLGADFSNNVRLFGSGEQTKSVMALSANPMERAQPDHPSNWALQDVGNTGYGTNQQNLDIAYRPLLLLASGLQMAGPRLTPETFERGLHRATFPNPAHRIMPGAVGFNDGDHSMTDDAVEAWWSNTERTPYLDQFGSTGTFCYVDHGARRRMGTFPHDDSFFHGPCHNGAS